MTETPQPRHVRGHFRRHGDKMVWVAPYWVGVIPQAEQVPVEKV
jgi:hypothetical protein